ncbi:MAG: Elongation factor P--(R)-beta-lysine ligase [Candidatus Anoxychlamydiales bacterium]|nr:Elongation factor P--(R)-beta-lysine ligase [Candidatus Anoxychlamydiales bacterium]
MYLESKSNILKDRSNMLKKVRSFFYKKNIIEVDPPHILKHPSIDQYIEPIECLPKNDETFYLHTSPEYMMKRLLSFSLEDMFFLGHVYRKDEIGEKHNFEFTMIEWYRKNISFENFLKDIFSVVKLFIDIKNIKKLSYRNIFLEITNLDFIECKKNDLINYLKNKKIDFDKLEKSFDDLLNIIFTEVIEKNFLKDTLYIIYDYPSSQAMLSKTHQIENIEYAKRFEIYYNSYELGNGFHELNDEIVQRKRFVEINKKRDKKLPLDEKFLSSLNHLEDCYGIAIGFDRLMMLRHNKKNINDVISISFNDL